MSVAKTSQPLTYRSRKRISNREHTADTIPDIRTSSYIYPANLVVAITVTRTCE